MWDTHPLFGHQELALGVLLLDVVVLDLHLVGELQPLLERFGRGPATPRLQLLLGFLQSHAHLPGRGRQKATCVETRVLFSGCDRSSSAIKINPSRKIGHALNGM